MLSILLCTLAACSGFEQTEREAVIVVDGWIEDGGYPIVMVTTSLPVSTSSGNVADLKDNIARWALVTVSDGQTKETLTGMTNKNYFPPYIYTTSRMKGEAGKTYTLEVTNKGRKVTAVTTIPEKVPFDRIEATRAENGGYSISAEFTDPDRAGDAYKIFTRVEKQDSCFKSSFMGVLDDSSFQGNRIHTNIFPPEIAETNRFSMNFPAGSVVHVKFCTMDEQALRYWSDFENVVNLSRNPLLPVCIDIRSNIEGGLGLWAGYGASCYTVLCPGD